MEAVPVVSGVAAFSTAPLKPLGTSVRWATLALSLVLAAMSGEVTVRVGAWALALAAVTLWQSEDRATSGRVPALAGLAVATVAVVTTGTWSSPFVLCLLGAIVTIGFVGGIGAGLMAAAGVSLAVALPYHLDLDRLSVDSLRTTGQWTIEFLLIGILAGYARRLFGEVREQHTAALDRMSQLNEANELLVSLHRVAQSLPASLDLQQVLASTIGRLRSLVDCDMVAVLLHDDATGTWTVAASEGAALPRSIQPTDLPRPLAAATASSVASLVVSLGPGEGLGPDVLSRSGLYAPLRARGTLLGLIAIEQHEPGFYGRRDLRILDGFVEPAALAIDNARWFSRLRTIGADEERVRIARDIHDSVGQSLAFVAFKLDRLAAMAEDEKMHDELDTLRTEVRGVLTDVRDTLCDLRTEVTDGRDLVGTLEEFLDRVRARADFDVAFEHESTGRLPLVQEQEIWRLAHEAVSNVEHHARARHVRVSWACDGHSGRLTVTDDGRGFDVERGGRSGSYGLLGMRERANAIGARLDIKSKPTKGTVVECIVSPVTVR